MIRWLIVAVAVGLLGAPALAGPRVLVVSKQGHSLQSFDAVSYAKQFDVVVSGEPHVVVTSRDGKFAYVADFVGFANVLSVIDLDQKRIASTISFKPSMKAHGMAVTRDGTRLFATCEASRAVAEVDLPAGKVTRRFKLNFDNCHLLALSPDETTLFVTSAFDGNVSMLDAATGAMRYAVKTGKGAEGVDVSPDGREVWVVNRTYQNISVVDVKTHRNVQDVLCEGGPLRVEFSPDGKTAAVTCSISGDLVFIDTATRKETARIPAGIFPSEVVYSTDGARCFVTDSKTGEVIVVDTAARKVVHRFPVGPDPEGIAFVP
jgi:YVTN family beta-propeller protein